MRNELLYVGANNKLVDMDDLSLIHIYYGFGHNHMWVKESGSLERLILVEF